MWQVYFILSFKIFNTLHRRICLIKENHILDFPQVQNQKKDSYYTYVRHYKMPFIEYNIRPSYQTPPPLPQ